MTVLEPTFSVKSNAKVEKAILEIERLSHFRVLVGIPGDNVSRTGDPATPNNATLGYLHEFGDPSTNLPARPWLVPGVVKSLNDAQARFSYGMRQELTGKQQGAMLRAMNAVGLQTVSSVRAYIGKGIPPPITLRAKYSRLQRRATYAKASPARQAAMAKKFLAGTFIPLIDTGQMRNSVTYVIRKK